MKNLFSFFIVTGFSIAFFSCTETEAQSTPPPAAKINPMADYIQANVTAASEVLAAFEGKQLDSLQLKFDDPDRTEWNNLPIHEYPRKGVPLKSMSDAQKIVVQRLMQAGLSDVGYLKVNWLLWNDERRKEDRKKMNSPVWQFYGHNNFWLTIFGEPSASEAWGWQLEGHHLSINLTFKNGQVAMSPLFLGADPGVVLDGPFAGFQVLKVETNTGWKLFESLTKEQRATAIVADKPFADILTRMGTEEHTKQTAGLSYKDMNTIQRKLLLEIVEEYVGTFPEAPAAAYLEKVYQAADDSISFIWAGDTKAGAAIYYRIHGPGFVIEFDNRSGEQNHIHSVWYDLDNTFGKNF